MESFDNDLVDFFTEDENDRKGNMLYEVWRKPVDDGFENFRENGPNYIEYSNITGKIILEEWNYPRKGDLPTHTKYYHDGKIQAEIWQKNGLSHRENGYAEIHYHNNGNVKNMSWMLNGKYYNNGLVFVNYYYTGNIKELVYRKTTEENDVLSKKISYYDNGIVRNVLYEKNNELHNTEGPAVITYYDNGKLENFSWFVKGKLYRLDAPAYASYYNNGDICDYTYFNNNARHNGNGPAYAFYVGNKIRVINYFVNSAKHRTDGPAIINYSNDGSVKSVEWVNNNMIHRLDGPSSIIVNDHFTHFAWSVNGKSHNLNGPSYALYDSSFRTICLEYKNMGKWHNPKGPCLIKYDMYGEIISLHYKINNQYHREHGPAKIEYYKNKVIECGYYIHGVLHNDIGAAYIYDEKKHYIVNGIMKNRQYILQYVQYIYTFYFKELINDIICIIVDYYVD